QERKSELKQTPHTTKITVRDANLAEGFATRTPAVVDNGEGSTIPTTSTAPCFAFMGQLAEQFAPCFVGPSIAGIIGEMQQVAKGQGDLVRGSLRRGCRGGGDGRRILWRGRNLWRTTEKFATGSATATFDGRSI